MELPIELREKIDENIASIDIKSMKKSAQNISRRYRDKTQKKTNNQLITNKTEAIAYAASRMPATYGAIYSALEHTMNIIDFNTNEKALQIKSLLDIGAGTGAAGWASTSILNIEKITCIENEKYMMEIGKDFMQAGYECLKNANWINKNIIKDKIEEKADLVIAAYVINEIAVNERQQVLEKLWQSTNKVLLIVEPGTPEGYEEIIKIREYFIEKGENIVAPCQHNKRCKIEEKDWCSFSCRVSRSKVHKILKDGDSPYEDEKFFYIAISKFKTRKASNIILRHPKIESGKITLKLCNSSGNIEEKIITKKEKEIFKKVKKLNCGDILNI